MERLTFGTDGTSGALRCAKDHAHPLQIVRSDDRLIGWCRTCFDFATPGYDVLGSLAWYDDHENLWLLLKWLGSGTDAVSAIEKPWNWHDEFLAAQAVATHERETEESRPSPFSGRPLTFGHTVYRGDDDTAAFCNDCPWEFRDGLVGERELEPDPDPQPFDMSGSSRHQGRER